MEDGTRRTSGGQIQSNEPGCHTNLHCCSTGADKMIDSEVTSQDELGQSSQGRHDVLQYNSTNASTHSRDTDSSSSRCVIPCRNRGTIVVNDDRQINGDVDSALAVLGGEITDSSTDDEKSSLLARTSPKAYAVRWYVLTLFSLAALLQGGAYGTYGPITQSCKAVFGWDNNNIAVMALAGNLTFSVFCVPFTWLLEHKGLRVSMALGMALMTAGFGVRCITMYSPWAAWTMTIGQGLIGGGAVVPFSGVSMMSSVWFPLRQRATATSVAAMFGYLGLALSFVIGPLAVPEFNSTTSGQVNVHPNMTNGNSSDIEEQRNAIAALLYYEAGATGVVLLLILIYFPAKPPTPPTYTAHVNRLNIRKGLNRLIRNKQFLLVMLAFSVGTGVYGSFSIILDIDVEPIGVSQTTAGWLGFYGTVGGCAAGFFVAWLSDLFMRQLKVFLLLLMIPTAITLTWFCLLVGSYISYNEGSLYIATVAPAVCVYGSVPLFYELTCEAAYPTGEGMTTLILGLVSNVMGAVFLGLLSIPDIGVIWMNYFLIGSIVVCIVILLVTRVTYHRTNLDIQEIVVPPPPSPGDLTDGRTSLSSRPPGETPPTTSETPPTTSETPPTTSAITSTSYATM